MIRYSDHKDTIGDILNAFPHMDFQEAYEYIQKQGCVFYSVPSNTSTGDAELDALINGDS